MAIEKLYLGVTTGDKKGDGAKDAGAKINAAFDYLENKIDSKDRVLVSTGFTQLGSVMTINAGWQWMINGITYTNPVAVEITFPLAEMDLERIDNVVATTSNTFMRIPGVEAVTPIAPLYQAGTVIISFSVINDAEIAEPDTPINNTDYVLKSEQYYTPVNSSGVLLKVGKKSAGTGINFLNAATVVGSLEVKPTYFNRLFDGVIYSIKNSQSIDIVFNHLDGTGNVLFSFPTATNFTLKPNEIFQCKLRITSSNTAVFDYIGVAGSAGGVGLPIDITDVTGLTAELADRYTKSEVDAKVASVYVFKGNVANYAALPSTGLTIGDVYNLTDTGENYAWTGTVWDNLGTTIDVSGKENASNKTATVTGNEASTSLYLNILGAVNYFQQKLTDSIFGTFINSLTGKSTPIDADSISIVDTGDGNKQKKVSLTNFKAFLKTYFDTQYKTDTQSFAISDLTTALATGDVHVGYATYNFTITSFWIGAKTAPTISSLVVDVKKNGTSITSTKAGIDATELTSLTGTAPVLTTTSFTKGDLITANIYQVGSGETGRGLQLYLEIIKT